MNLLFITTDQQVPHNTHDHFSPCRQPPHPSPSSIPRPSSHPTPPPGTHPCLPLLLLMGRSRFAAQRWDSLACLSPAHSFMQTPHIEALASRGTVFERCYTTAPLCVPMRASVMSGMYASTTGIMANNHWLSPATPVWSSAAADAGFATAAIGKMHFAPWDDLGGFAERIIAEDKRHVYLPDDHAVFLAEHGHERAHPTANPGYFENLGASVTPLPKRFHIGTTCAGGWCCDSRPV